jgi:ribonuclease HII
MLYLGIDDAGRGPVIGPMVLAGCLIDDKLSEELKKLGVKDSKQLTPIRRESLAKIIKEKAETFEIVIVHPKEIDGKDDKGLNLNDIEALKCAEIINKINKGYGKIKVVIDCPSPNLLKWQDYLKRHVKDLSNLEVSCEHKADKNHISCSAASIIAKTTRDSEIEKIKERIGENFGSGYSSDPLTIRFLEKHALKYREDGIFRETWDTWRKAIANANQMKLNGF